MIEIIPNWHPIFVHFTVALLSIAVVTHLLSLLMAGSEMGRQLIIVSRWNLRIGVGITLLTAAAGWYAYNTVAHDTPSHLAMIEHRNLAIATVAIFLGIAVWEYLLSRSGKVKNLLLSAVLVIAAGLLLTTAWHGAELVYRYGLGVMSLPKAENDGHDHAHGEEHGDAPAQSPGKQHDEAHGHDDATHSEHPQEAHPHDDAHPHDAQSHDAMPMSSPIAVDVAASAPKKAGHSHAPGTLPHKD